MAAEALTPVQFGDTGEAVTLWQEKLNELGYPVAVDGSFGPGTDDATRALQRSLGIKVDGVVGSETLDSLGRVHELQPVEVSSGGKTLLWLAGGIFALGLFMFGGKKAGF